MEEIIMDNSELIERLQVVIDLLTEGDRDRADGELYAIFDELEFVSDDYTDDDEEEDFEDEDDEFIEEDED
jgi:hypothetical protein